MALLVRSERTGLGTRTAEYLLIDSHEKQSYTSAHRREPSPEALGNRFSAHNSRGVLSGPRRPEAGELRE